MNTKQNASVIMESPSALCPLEKKMPLQIFPESLWAIVPLILPGTKQE